MVRWTNSPKNGLVGRMKRTIKEAAAKRFSYESRRRVTDFVSACNFVRRLKTFKGLTPCDFICKRRPPSQNASD